MRYLIMIITSVIVSLNCQENDLIYFSRDVKSLLKCIDEHYLFKDKNQNYENSEIIKAIATLTAKKFSRKIKEREHVEVEVKSIIMSLQSETSLPSTLEIPWGLLETNTMLAVIDCSGSSSSTQVDNLPQCDNTLGKISELLKYILVDWPEPPIIMISSEFGQELLRRYAKDAMKKLVDALESLVDYNHFRVVLLEVWIDTAKQFYDGRNGVEFLYIPYRYTWDGSLLVGIEMSYFHSRRNVRFHDRNPLVSQNMTSAEYYLEAHLKQFFKILLYSLAQVTGTSSDDINEGNESVRAILYNDEAYQAALLKAQECAVNSVKMAENEVMASLSSALTSEEYLITWLRFGTNIIIESSISMEETFDGSILENGDVNQDARDCLRNSLSRNSIETVTRAVPYFEGEPHDLAIVLDYALVDWPTSLEEMLQSSEGREVLWGYADVAQFWLGCALKRFDDNGNFRKELTELWMRRARRYFDGQPGFKYHYIPHRYTESHPFPYTFIDIDFFEYRNDTEFTIRNPPAQESEINKMATIYGYRTNNMTSAEFYIKSHLDQFFRIILLYLEMQWSGASTNNDELYEKMPSVTRAIVYNDTNYEKYLVIKRKRIKSLMHKYNIKMKPATRVWEEDLIEFFIYCKINGFVNSTNLNTYTNTTTTTQRTMTTTPRYQDQSKSTDGVCVNDKKQCKSSSRGSKTNKLRQMRHNNNNHKKLNDAINIVKDETFLSMKILKNIYLLPGTPFNSLVVFVGLRQCVKYFS